MAAVIGEIAIACIHPPYDSLLNEFGTAIADVTIALGIAGEVIFGRLDARIQTELRSRSNRQLAGAVEAASKANERAANAELELERVKQPRLIKWWDFEQRKPLLLYKGTTFGLFADNDHEALRLAHDVARLLLISDWCTSPIVGFVDVQDGIVLMPDAVGVEIAFHRQPEVEKAEAAANALSKYLN